MFHISTEILIEMIGYIGSAIVLVSFLMVSVFRLRLINTVGSIIFTIYALLIHSYPTAVMNGCLALINIRFLWKMRHTGRQYELVEVDPSDRFLQHLLKKHYDDIRALFPGIDLRPDEDTEKVSSCFLVTHQDHPAGIAVGKDAGGGKLELILDYAVPEYRDFSVGEFLALSLKEKGFTRFVYAGPSEHHLEYLNKLGFIEKDGIYEKIL